MLDHFVFASVLVFSIYILIISTVALSIWMFRHMKRMNDMMDE